MSRQAQVDTTQSDNPEPTAISTIRQSIAHFFSSDNDDVIIADITDHTLRDIGVDRAVIDYL